MKELLNDDALDVVNGGKYQINGNNGKLLFTNDHRVFQLVNCSVFDAMGVLNGLMGQSSSDAEYDALCIAELEARGWITTIGSY